VRNSDCNENEIDLMYAKGIGCITLPGVQQNCRLKSTLWGTVVGIILKAVNVCILTFVNYS
jgi:hypothetical protein